MKSVHGNFLGINQGQVFIYIQTAVFYLLITNVRYGTTPSDRTCTRITLTAVVERHDCTTTKSVNLALIKTASDTSDMYAWNIMCNIKAEGDHQCMLDLLNI